MKVIRNKIHSLASNDSFFTDETLRKNNIILLIALFFFIFAQPIIKTEKLNTMVFDILISILIVSGITSLKFRKEKFIRLSYLGLFTFILLWTNYFVDTLITNLFTFSVLIIFMIYITYSMIYYVARNKKIKPVLVLNAINSYLLMGIISSFLFILTDVGYRLLFDIKNGTINFGYTTQPKFFDFIYFSFITLTTVGYGDVTPAVPITKSIAMFVSLSGQLYLTILVAMLVGKFSSKD
jgi:hypothetical protein